MGVGGLGHSQPDPRDAGRRESRGPRLLRGTRCSWLAMSVQRTDVCSFKTPAIRCLSPSPAPQPSAAGVTRFQGHPQGVKADASVCRGGAKGGPRSRAEGMRDPELLTPHLCGAPGSGSRILPPQSPYLSALPTLFSQEGGSRPGAGGRPGSVALGDDERGQQSSLRVHWRSVTAAARLPPHTCRLGHLSCSARLC